MNYVKNATGETVAAYKISSVLHTGENYSVSLLDAHKIVGLYPEQTINYAPVVGDFYIDNGEIIDSEIVNETDFFNNYTVA